MSHAIHQSNQYMKQPAIASTYCDFSDFSGKGRVALIAQHYKKDSLERRFKYLAGIYTVIHNHRTWMRTSNGKLLYDTNRGDGLPEVARVRRTSLEKLPLMLSRLKTSQGRAELARRLKEEA